MKCDISFFFLIFQKSKVALKSDKNKGYFT